jgi:cyanophycinase-like exopeptidase
MKLKIVVFLFFQLWFGKVISQDYTSYFIGDTADVNTASQFGITLMGGATEHDEAMKWFLERAAGGDVLVIRASGADGYNTYLYSGLGITVNSVETIVFNNAAASNSAYVINRVKNAEAIWIAGGDQYNYISYWQNTAIDSLLNLHIQKPASIGGTSAGMAILGSNYFSAENGTITSATALGNPYHANMTIGYNDFLHMPFMDQVITDTHYDSPDRKGRHMAFMSRITNDLGVRSFGIACDEYTAVCIDSVGKARAFGDYPTYDEDVWFLQSLCDTVFAPEVCTTGTPLTWDLGQMAVKAYNIKADYFGTKYFMLDDWKTGSGGNWEHWSVNSGILTTQPGTAIDCSGIGINELSISPKKLYPNPANDWIYVDCLEQKAMSIYNVYGVKCISNVKPGRIDISELECGFYFMRTEDETLPYSFIKVK